MLNYRICMETRPCICKWRGVARGDEIRFYFDDSRACYAGHLDVVKRLVECSGLDSLVMENIFSETPLHA